MDFGEIVTTTSRAFWNDYEDWEASRTPIVSVTLECDASDNCEAVKALDTFIVIEGTRISGFLLETLLTGLKPICQVAGRRCWLYLLAGRSIGVLLTEERDLMLFGQITELLLPYVRAAKRVITINVEPSVSYKVAAEDRTGDLNDACFIRGINTKGTDPTVVTLEEPNLITGIAAGVASWCKFSARSWASYVAYLNEPELNTLTTAPILRLLRLLGLPCTESYNAPQLVESNLYA